MIENNLLSYLNIGLPEDILRMKLHGDFDGAVRLIDRKLSDPALPDPLRYCLMAEREMILRMPSDYPFTREDALKKIRTRKVSTTCHQVIWAPWQNVSPKQRT
jgi:hypothetical protein